MTALWMAAAAWLAFALVGIPVLYVGYGFVMSAIVDRDAGRAAGLQPTIVEKVDAIIAAPFVFLDAMLNLLVMPVVCLDIRLKGWFRIVTFRGLRFPFSDLITARLKIYHADPDEWAYRKKIARLGVKFLDRKDPKGWHVAEPGSAVNPSGPQLG